MPLVNVKVYEQRVTPEFSAKVIERITDVICELTSEEMRQYTWVLVEGVPPSQWGMSGQPGG